MSDHKLDHFVNRALPPTIAEENPDFKVFVEKYFEYLSRDLGEYDVVANLLDYTNIDTSVDAFYNSFKQKYLPLLPEKYKTTLANIVKNSSKFYQTKGTEESYTTFFRMIFDSAVNLYYPKVDMLRCSDGRWIEPYYLSPLGEVYDDLVYFYDKNITGSVSGATAYVQLVTQINDPDNNAQKIFILSLVDIVGAFDVTDTITVTGESTPNFTIDSSGTKGIITDIGYWEDTEGFLSWNKYIQDSTYYQDYSYVLESAIPVDSYEKSVRDNLHPAGFNLFGLVTSGIELIDIGAALASYIDNIVIWINTELLITNIEENAQVLENLHQGTNIASAPDFDWHYFEKNKDNTPLLQLYPISALEQLTIPYIENNYPENFLDVSVDGSSTTAYTILNRVITLTTPLGTEQIIIVTTTDPDIHVNNRVYRIHGQVGQDTFYLPNAIKRVPFSGEVEPVITQEVFAF